MDQPYYSISGSYNGIPNNPQFPLHYHDEYEIFLFLAGDSTYVIEEKTYSLEPGDILVIRKHEMHRIFHNRPVPYQRVVLMIAPDFFRQYNCPDYEAQFLHPTRRTGNKIAAEIVHSSGLYDAFIRYRKYSEEYSLDIQSPVLIATIIEILYLINKTTGFSASDYSNGPLKSIISYLNNRYTEDITLDMLAEQFFLSKYYLCRSFHKATGLTVHQYITRKRLTLVKELRDEGKSIGEAAMQAGFKDYSSFYRAYQKQYGVSPREAFGKTYGFLNDSAKNQLPQP